MAGIEKLSFSRGFRFSSLDSAKLEERIEEKSLNLPLGQIAQGTKLPLEEIEKLGAPCPAVAETFLLSQDKGI